MKITKWHILGIVVLAVILGIWFTPVIPMKDDEGNGTVATLPNWLAKRFGGGQRPEPV